MEAGCKESKEKQGRHTYEGSLPFYVFRVYMFASSLSTLTLALPKDDYLRLGTYIK